MSTVKRINAQQVASHIAKPIGYHINGDGFKVHHYSDEANNAVWDLMGVNVQAGVIFTTPHDNITYQIVSEKQIGNDRYEVTVKVGRKTKTFKCNICNQDKKTLEAVRSL